MFIIKILKKNDIVALSKSFSMFSANNHIESIFTPGKYVPNIEINKILLKIIAQRRSK